MVSGCSLRCVGRLCPLHYSGSREGNHVSTSTIDGHVRSLTIVRFSFTRLPMLEDIIQVWNVHSIATHLSFRVFERFRLVQLDHFPLRFEPNRRLLIRGLSCIGPTAIQPATEALLSCHAHGWRCPSSLLQPTTSHRYCPHQTTVRCSSSSARRSIYRLNNRSIRSLAWFHP